jgi:hypothetical protein
MPCERTDEAARGRGDPISVERLAGPPGWRVSTDVALPHRMQLGEALSGQCVTPAQRSALLSGDPGLIKKCLSKLAHSDTLFSRLQACSDSLVVDLAKKEDARRLMRSFLGDLSGKEGILRARDPKTGDMLRPFPYQEEAAHRLYHHDLSTPPSTMHSTRLAIWPTGAGKTVLGCLSTACAWKRWKDPRWAGEQLQFASLYVVPIASVYQWKREILKWLRIDESDVVVVLKHHKLFQSPPPFPMITITTHSCIEEHYKQYTEHPNQHSIQRKLAPSAQQLRQHPGWDPACPPPISCLIQALDGDKNVFSSVVWDEAEKLRNPATFLAHAARHIFSKAAYGVVLSATPVANRPEEWASILSCMAVGNRFELASTFQTIHGNLSERSIRACHRELVDSVKESDLDLPRKTVMTVTFDPFVSSDGVDHYNKLVQDAADGSRNVMGCISGMEQGAFHPTLMVVGASDFSQRHLNQCLAHPSNTMRMLHKTIKEIQCTGRLRIVVYCQHATMNTVSCAYEEKIGTSGTTFTIDGGSSARQRDATVSKFLNTCGRALLFITTAGGKALNIDKGCETIILYGTADWSPADQQQAIGRVYRVTQPRDVLVVHLRSRDTASFFKQSETMADKGKRLMPAFHNLDFCGLRKKQRRLGWGNEDEYSDDDQGECKGITKSWKRRAGWSHALPLLETDGNPPYSKETTDAAKKIKQLRDAPEGTEQDVLCVLRGKVTAREYVLPAFPPRGNDRFCD